MQIHNHHNFSSISFNPNHDIPFIQTLDPSHDHLPLLLHPLNEILVFKITRNQIVTVEKNPLEIIRFSFILTSTP